MKYPLALSFVLCLLSACSGYHVTHNDGSEYFVRNRSGFSTLFHAGSYCEKSRVFNQNKKLVAEQYVWYQKSCPATAPLQREIVFLDSAKNPVRKITVTPLSGSAMQVVSSIFNQHEWMSNDTIVVSDSTGFAMVKNMFYLK